MAKMTASLMWKTGAFKVSLDKPFELVSGNYSPIYVDCRSLISDAVAMDLIAAFIHWLCEAEGIKFDTVAGGESAGIPFAAFASQRMAKPMIYVRKKTKDYGTKSLVEGHVEPGMTALLVEDLVTDGKSKLGFVEGLRDAKLNVTDCIVVFDRLQGGTDRLAAESVRLFALTDIGSALQVGSDSLQLAATDREEISRYLDNPRQWHVSRGLVFTDHR